MSDYVIVLTTMPAGAEAEDLAGTLVGEGLAACVNVLPPMTSIYKWKGQLQRDTERQLVIKTLASHVEPLRDRLSAGLHPYEVPEFLVLDVRDGSQAYLAWLRDSVSPAPA